MGGPATLVHILSLGYRLDRRPELFVVIIACLSLAFTLACGLQAFTSSWPVCGLALTLARGLRAFAALLSLLHLRASQAFLLRVLPAELSFSSLRDWPAQQPVLGHDSDQAFSLVPFLLVSFGPRPPRMYCPWRAVAWASPTVSGLRSVGLVRFSIQQGA